MLKFIEKRYPGKRGVLISNPYAVFSKNQEEMFGEKLATPQYSSVKIKTMQLQKDLSLSAYDLNELVKNPPAYIALTPYADESAKLLEQIDQRKVDVPLITNSSWTTGDVDFGRRFLVTKKTPIYSATVWVKGSPESKPFEKIIQRKYGRPATAEIAYGYDLGLIVGTTLSALNGNYSRQAALAAIHKLRCFKGGASGTLCFHPSGGHAERTILFSRFTKSGFVAEPQ